MISWPGGLYGNGMHRFVLDEAELGFRVAAWLDEEAAWTAADMIFFAWMPVDPEPASEGRQL